MVTSCAQVVPLSCFGSRTGTVARTRRQEEARIASALLPQCPRAGAGGQQASQLQRACGNTGLRTSCASPGNVPLQGLEQPEGAWEPEPKNK